MPNQHEVRVADISGLLALVPRLVGYDPRPSSVVVCFLSGQTLALSMRFDLEDLVQSQTVDHARRAARRVDADNLIIIGYTAALHPALAGRLRSYATEIEIASLETDRLTIVEVVHVGGDRWRTLTGRDPLTSTTDGMPYADIEHHPVAAYRRS